MTRSFLILTAASMLAACSQAEQAAPETDPADNAAEPADAAASTGTASPAPTSLPPDIAKWVKAEYGEYGNVSYRVGRFDLDGDGTQEFLVYIGGLGQCGSGGCPLAIVQQTGQGPDPLGELSVARMPVGVFESSTNGWRDLAVTVSGGGMSGGVARVPFGENAYASNPTVAPAEITDEAFTTVIEEGELAPLD